MMIGLQLSCKKYLDYKPDKKLALPTTLNDCRALMDNYAFMNSSYPSYAEAVSDNIYILETNYNALPVGNRDTYLWKSEADLNFGDWQSTYQKILYANQVLETLSKITPSANDQNTWNEIKGTALFFRSYALFQAAQIWAKPYDVATANQDFGIPVKLTPDLNEKTERGTVKQTYDRIVLDMEEAVGLLPATTIFQSRPSKIAANAALARFYLAMGEYTKAGDNADACLQKYNTLLDYNQLNGGAAYPISQFNKEVIFQSTSVGGTLSMLFQSVAKINEALYLSYEMNDLRRTVFFTTNSDLTHSFKGNYDGSDAFSSFSGLATDEVYLIRAECFARAGRTSDALSDLNTLLKARWSNAVPYVNKSAATPNDALKLVLTERRKELVHRHIRWSDLRRLNKDADFAITLTRSIGGQNYTLAPNDLRYVLRIPNDVLSRTNIPQNPR